MRACSYRDDNNNAKVLATATVADGIEALVLGTRGRDHRIRRRNLRSSSNTVRT